MPPPRALHPLSVSWTLVLLLSTLTLTLGMVLPPAAQETIQVPRTFKFIEELDAIEQRWHDLKVRLNYVPDSYPTPSIPLNSLRTGAGVHVNFGGEMVEAGDEDTTRLAKIEETGEAHSFYFDPALPPTEELWDAIKTVFNVSHNGATDPPRQPQSNSIKHAEENEPPATPSLESIEVPSLHNFFAEVAETQFLLKTILACLHATNATTSSPANSDALCGGNNKQLSVSMSLQLCAMKRVG
jgi:hypothetical protein